MSQVTTEIATPRPAGPLDYGRALAPSKAARWTGRVISVLPVFALGMSAVMKFMPPSKEVAEGFEHLGWPLRYAIALGVVELTWRSSTPSPKPPSSGPSSSPATWAARSPPTSASATTSSSRPSSPSSPG